MSSSGQTDVPLQPLARDYPKGHRVARHRHDRGQLIYARSGIMTVITADGTWVVPSQRALWVPAETDHEVVCGTAVSMRTLLIAAPAAAELPDACVVVHVPPLLRELILVAVEGEPPAQQRRHVDALILEGIRDGQVAPLHLPEPADARLRRITAAIAADPGDRRTLAEWARQAGASPRTLTRRFVDETGMTFQQWQRQARLLTALVRLAQAQAVTTVALDLGYDSPSAFIHAFRRALGSTPGRYFEPPRRPG
jgi:AraC-like DNA-binding protein